MKKELALITAMLLASGTAFAQAGAGASPSRLGDLGKPGATSAEVDPNPLSEADSDVAESTDTLESDSQQRATLESDEERVDQQAQLETQDQAATGSFQQFDADQSGGLSDQEFAQAGIFDQLDENGDGYLSALEVTAQDMIYELDKDMDKQVSREEFFQAVFARADTDGSGDLSEEEFNAAMGQPAPRG